MSRLPIVGVMGSSEHSHAERAAALGRWLAEAGVHLLTGGGWGAMAAVSEAFHRVRDRKGVVIGILPGRPGAQGSSGGYPNPWVEIPIVTHLPFTGAQGTDPLSRNHLNVLSSDVIVALPGGAGTLSEVLLARRYGRPLVAWLEARNEILGLPDDVPVESDFDRVKAFVRKAVGRP